MSWLAFFCFLVLKKIEFLYMVLLPYSGQYFHREKKTLLLFLDSPQKKTFDMFLTSATVLHIQNLYIFIGVIFV